MATALVRGTVSHAPERITLRNGVPCVTTIVKGKDGNRTRFWHIAAFSETVQAALMHLATGDPIILQGTVKTELQERNGEIVLSVAIIAERILDVPPRFTNRILAALEKGHS